MERFSTFSYLSFLVQCQSSDHNLLHRPSVRGFAIHVLCFMLAVWLVCGLSNWPKWRDAVLIILTIILMVLIYVCVPE